MTDSDFQSAFPAFKIQYIEKNYDEIWRDQSQQFKDFWYRRVLKGEKRPISDEDCDQIIRILDRNGKGNSKSTQAIARAMIPQGAWRRIFNEFHHNKAMGSIMTALLEEVEPQRKAQRINELYKMNEGQKNNLTGPSGNAVSTFLAAFDPFQNLSIISLKDRVNLLEYLGLSVDTQWDELSIGEKIIDSNTLLLDAFKKMGFPSSARMLSVYCYSSEIKGLWKNSGIVKTTEKSVSVTIPAHAEDEVEEQPPETLRESFKIQGLLAYIGAKMGFSIWLPKSDRKRVQEVWHPEPGQLVDALPLGYDSMTMKTIEQIDVIWLRKRSIARAFEVEHTTSIYSGLLRMADLIALQPNINIKLHIVAPIEREDKVLSEIKRPVFSLLEGRELAEMCTFLSYDKIIEISEMEYLNHMSDKFIENCEERAN